MRRSLRSYGRMFRGILVAWVAVVATSAVYAGGAPRAARSMEQSWRRTLDRATHGDFPGAMEAIRKVQEGHALTDQVRSWLEEYEAQQAERRSMDSADLDKYVGYAKARIERSEYSLALGWALAAQDTAEEPEEFLKAPWLQDLVNDSLEAAAKMREEQDWRKAWRIYAQLSGLFEREERYQKLEREVLTHLRLDTMFKKDDRWKERVENVRWSDAENALELIDRFYVEETGFAKIAQGGLEQLLLLTESKIAREKLEGLANEDDRNDFVSRVTRRIEQIRNAPFVDRAACVQHFRRILKINRQTINLSKELVVYEMMRGALDPLDDFTAIIWPQASNEFDKHTRGNFVGVGISIILNRAEEVEVVTPMDGTPAYRAGIVAGDVIIAVDGKPLKGNSLNKVVDIITGPKGTPVELTIRRGTEELLFPLVRARVKIQSVKGINRDPQNEEHWDYWLDRERGIAYLKVTNFQRNTVEDIANALSELTAQGLEGLVLDLRGNPGGLLDSAWHLSSLFLKRGDTVVKTRGRIKTEDHSFEAHADGPFSDLELAVLADERSASASEIVSGAIRDNRRGTVIGERTFGKFSVQNLMPLGRSGAKLKITTARYYLPNGDSLHREATSVKWGVDPDVPVRMVAKERRKVYEMQRKANLLGPPKPKKVKKDEDEKDEAEDIDSAKSDGDAQPGDEIADESAKKKDGEGDEDKADDGHDGDDPDEAKVAELPKLEQPDENERPEVDPQLDAALLFMRIKLLGYAMPTLATADQDINTKRANP